MYLAGCCWVMALARDQLGRLSVLTLLLQSVSSVDTTLRKEDCIGCLLELPAWGHCFHEEDFEENCSPGGD